MKTMGLFFWSALFFTYVNNIEGNAMKLLVFILAGAAIYLTYLDASQGNDLVNQQARYCKMVKLHQETDGKNGWPDYNGNAKEVCHE